MPSEGSGEGPRFRRREGRGSRSTDALRILITIAALLFAAGHIIWPDLKIDGVLLILLVVSLVPWLGSIFKSIELPGLFKGEYQELRNDVEELKGATSEARGAASSAQQKAELAFASSEIEASHQGPADKGKPSRTPGEFLAELVRRYNDLQKVRPSDTQRSASNRIVLQMISLAPRLGSFDWMQALQSSDPGTRLAGFAYLYARPDSGSLMPVVQSLVLEYDAFRQYWAIQALRRILSVSSQDAARAAERPLRGFLQQLQPGTDRHYELTRLLKDLETLTAG
jgi:hypothetical protein